jgi:osmotically-inducible protein OsmY
MSQLATSPKTSFGSASDNIHAAVGDALSRSSYATLGLVDYDVDGDHVVLRGNVRSYFLKQMAQALVQRLAGVRRVENRLVVARPAAACI